jgi:hypothetical protein
MISVGTEEQSRTRAQAASRWIGGDRDKAGDAAGRGQTVKLGEIEPAWLTQPRLRHWYYKFADTGTDTFSIQSTHSTLANKMVNDTYL